MKKKLPVVVAVQPLPATAQAAAHLTVTPVVGASRPEFPTRSELSRRASLSLGLGGALLAAACSSSAKPPVAAPEPAPVVAEALPAEPTPAPPPVEPAAPTEPVAPVEPVKPVEPVVAMKDGSINGIAIDAAKTPKFKVYREGGGIGPAEDMWEPTEVEAFINWTFVKEGKLNLKTAVKFELDGVTLELDGFDADKKVGYEYIDKLDMDPAVSKDVRAKLEAWMKAKKVAILFIDMKKTPDQATLKGKIVKFLADVKKTPPTPGAL